MTVTAAKGIIGFGLQSGMGVLATKFYRHRAMMVDLDTIDETREGAPEVGGIPIPTFPYKAGPVVGGGFTIQPRLESTLGWLLYGLLGDVDSSIDEYATADVYDHVFGLKAGEEEYVPWMSFRKSIPGKAGDPTSELGQQFKDCKIIGGTLVLPNDAPLTMRVDVLGREFSLVHGQDEYPWEWENEFEHWESIPVGCMTGGFLKINEQELPVVAAQVGFQNVPLDIRQERIYGSPFLEDITIVQRRLTYDITVKYNDPDLYATILTGTPTGTEWSGQPHTGSFEVVAVSGQNMPLEAIPYQLTISAGEVMMNQVGGIALAANQGVMMRFSGVALEGTAAYATFTLKNKVEEYEFPV